MVAATAGRVAAAAAGAAAATRVNALEQLVTLVSYHDLLPHLPAYIEDLRRVTLNLIATGTEDEAMNAIEFWSTVADEEAALQDDDDGGGGKEGEEGGEGGEGEEGGGGTGIVRGSLQSLVPVLTATLLKQDADAEGGNEAWNASQAAGACLHAVYQVAGGVMLKDDLPFLSFITENMKAKDASSILAAAEESWRNREAACAAVGAIIDGPSTALVEPLINGGLLFLLLEMTTSDAHIKVRDTAGWVIAKIAQHHPACIVEGDAGVEHSSPFEQVVDAWIETLGDAPVVAHQACFAIHNLAAVLDDGDRALHTLFGTVLDKLEETAARDDGNEHNLVISAYEAINMMVERCEGEECLNRAGDLVPPMLQRLEELQGAAGGAAAGSTAAGGAGGAAAGGTAGERRNMATRSILGSIQTVVAKYGDEKGCLIDAMGGIPYTEVVDTILRLTIAAMAYASDGGGGGGRPEELNSIEAIMVVATVCQTVGPEFERWHNEFFPLLMEALGNHGQSQVRWRGEGGEEGEEGEESEGEMRKRARRKRKEGMKGGFREGERG